MSSLEVLLKAEATLMDPDQPFEFSEWTHCTCGHIYHGATGEYAPHENGIATGRVTRPEEGPYKQVMKEVAEALDLVGWNGENPDYPQLISDYTKTVSGLTYEMGHFPYSKVTREDSLKVIREAIEKIRAADQAVIVKTLDAHHYETV